MDLFKAKAISDQRDRELAAARQLPDPLGRSLEVLMRDGGAPDDYRAAALALSSLVSQGGSPNVQQAAMFLKVWCESQAAGLDRYYPSSTAVTAGSATRLNYRVEGMSRNGFSAISLRSPSQNSSSSNSRLAEHLYDQRAGYENDHDKWLLLLKSLDSILRSIHLSRHRDLLTVPPHEIRFAAQLSSRLRDRGSLEAVAENAATMLSAAFLQGWSGTPSGLAALLAILGMPPADSLTPVYVVNCSTLSSASATAIGRLDRLLDVMEVLPQHGISLCSLGPKLTVDIPLTKPSLLNRIPAPVFVGECNIATLFAELSQLAQSDEAQVAADMLRWRRPVIAMFWDEKLREADQAAQVSQIKELGDEHPNALVIHYVLSANGKVCSVAHALSEVVTNTLTDESAVLVAGDAVSPIEHLAATLCVRAAGVGTMAAPEGWSLRSARTKSFAVTPVPFLAADIDPFLISGDGFQVLAAMKVGTVGWGHAGKSPVVWVVPEPALGRLTVFVPTDNYPIDADERDILSELGFQDLGHGWRRWCTRDQAVELIEGVVSNVLKLRDRSELEVCRTGQDANESFAG